MSVYSVKGKGWRYDFTQNGQRYSKCWFKTKAEAKQAEALKREELKKPTLSMEQTPTDMAFLELVNLRLDYLKAYKSEKYYVDHIYTVKGFVKEWRKLCCSEIALQMVQRYLIKRSRVSTFTANKDLRYLRALFNFGIKQGLVATNPTQGLEFMPVERKLKYVPPKEDVAKVLLAADPDIQDYLLAIMDTMGRMSEINRLALPLLETCPINPVDFGWTRTIFNNSPLWSKGMRAICDGRSKPLSYPQKSRRTPCSSKLADRI